MADTPGTPKKPTDYDAHILQTSREVLERSYKLLKDTTVPVAPQSCKPVAPKADDESGTERK